MVSDEEDGACGGSFGVGTTYPTTRGGLKLSFKGYRYCKDRKTSEKIYWRCEDRTCFGRAVSQLDLTILRLKEHDHLPEAGETQVQVAVSKMKTKAKTSTEPTSAIVNQEISQLNIAFRPYLQKESVIKRGIQRSRRQNQPALPATI